MHRQLRGAHTDMADDAKGRFLHPESAEYIAGGLRAARPLKGVPSATTVLGECNVWNDVGLKNWEIGKRLELSLEHGIAEGESVEAYNKRLGSMHYRQNVMSAANQGSEMHDELQNATQGLPTAGKWSEHIAPVLKWKEEKGLEFLELEQAFVSPLGFGGTIDVTAKNKDGQRLIVDYKSRNSTSKYKMRAYPKELCQAAAYGVLRWGLDAVMNGEIQGCNVLISRNEPGKTEIVGYPPEKMIEGWQLFKSILHTFFLVKKYDPRP
ncbi:PD-(D/E)XK nuclease family protein [Verrucomicrobia bacterium]|nr:PD-(D/E)XK nuclease family protein [Verrucomicrobiota bacterium]